MSDTKNLENDRDQIIRKDCVDLATRVVGKPVWVDNEKQHDDVVEVAKKIYDFILAK